MRKFFILLKKEIKELLTPQMLVPFLLVIVVFYAFGQYSSKQAKKDQGPQPIAVMDQDDSPLSKGILDNLNKANFSVKLYPNDGQDFPSTMRKDKIIIGLIIPAGFSESIQKLQPEKIETYSLINNFSVTGIGKYANLDRAIAVINEVVSTNYLTLKVPSIDPSLLKNPIKTSSLVIVKGRMAQASPQAVLGYITTQTSTIPVILFLVIVLASQMIATSIASEKENKTLETLLTAPLNRKIVITAKMIAAGFVGLLLASVYLLGFRSFTSGVGTSFGTTNVGTALNDLGLVLTPTSYLLLGLVVFLGILVALSISVILGAFADDVKGVQGAIAPLMVLMLIPYFAVLLLDINALPNVVRYFIYAIPFSHIFLAMPNLYLHNSLFVILGALYELIIFIIFTWLAAWIFSTDKIMTLKFNFGRKKKSREN